MQRQLSRLDEHANVCERCAVCRRDEPADGARRFLGEAVRGGEKNKHKKNDVSWERYSHCSTNVCRVSQVALQTSKTDTSETLVTFVLRTVPSFGDSVSDVGTVVHWRTLMTHEQLPQFWNQLKDDASGNATFRG